MSARDIKRRFATLPVIQALAAVRCGFELETQAVDGATYEELQESDDPEFDDAAFDSHVREHVGCIMHSSEFVTAVVTARPIICGGIRWSISALRAITVLCDGVQGSPATLSGLPLPFHDAVQSYVYDVIHECLDREDYYTHSRGALGLNVPSGLAAKADSSVEGPEFVVAGSGTTAGKFMSLLRTLLARYTLDVDAGCSFHVHLSVPGLTHAYGPNLQCHMMEFLLRNVDQAPDGVRTRWRESVTYFRPRISEDKYTFVHFHQELKTWEFRCFGNVNSVRDGMRCLKLAVAALQYAYRVSLGLTRPVFPSAADWDADHFTRVLHEDTSLEAVAKGVRTDARNAERNAA